MTARALPPFRADHVGSLLRPPELTHARAEHAAGRIDAAALRAVEDDAIRDVVDLQARVGLQTVTDGEFRRGSWHMDFIYQLGGIERAEGAFTSHFRNQQGELTFTPSGIEVTGRVHLDHPVFAEDFTFVHDDHAGGDDAEADDPLAEHGPLPGRTRGDRQRDLSRHGGVLE